jgi:glycosyltransferase involved in cell wall biosynthesis
MRCLFVHSARFVQTPDGLVHCAEGFPSRIWSRYLEHFSSLSVLVRLSSKEQIPDNWNLSSRERVNFFALPDDHGNLSMQLQRRRFAKPIIDEALSDIDAVIVRQSAVGWLVAKAAEKRGIPWAVEVVGDAWDAFWNYGSLAGKFYAPIAHYATRHWIARAKFAIYVTQHYLQHRYPCGGHLGSASNVELTPTKDGVLSQRLSKNYKSCDQLFVFGMIGSLVNKYKGLHIALRALKQLKDGGYNVQLKVLGGGRLEYWKEYAGSMGLADSLQLDGVLPSGEAVSNWLDSLDIYIQPSFQEGLPRALIEAMSRGLPSLGSSCGGIPELLEKNFLHKPGDAKTLASQMAKLINDKSLRQESSERNFEEAKKYDRERVEAKRHAFWASFAEHVIKSKR